MPHPPLTTVSSPPTDEMSPGRKTHRRLTPASTTACARGERHQHHGNQRKGNSVKVNARKSSWDHIHPHEARNADSLVVKMPPPATRGGFPMPRSSTESRTTLRPVTMSNLPCEASRR